MVKGYVHRGARELQPPYPILQAASSQDLANLGNQEGQAPSPLTAGLDRVLMADLPPLELGLRLREALRPGGSILRGLCSGLRQ